jgi:hypothetical protein
MKDLIKKMLKEEFEDDFSWLDTSEPSIVKVIHSGKYYPAHTEAMLQLGITGVENFIKLYGEDWHSSLGEDLDDEDFLLQHLPKSIRPKNGDLCYIYEDKFVQGYNTKIYKLVRIEDGGEFIMNSEGFKYVE